MPSGCPGGRCDTALPSATPSTRARSNVAPDCSKSAAQNWPYSKVQYGIGQRIGEGVLADVQHHPVGRLLVRDHQVKLPQHVHGGAASRRLPGADVLVVQEQHPAGAA